MEEQSKALSELGEHVTIGELALTAIRAAIVSRRLRAGSRLVVDRLAEELHISRTPVKEALAKLEREGLVVTIPHRGTYVVKITRRDIEQLYALREVIEGLAARTAAQNISAEECARLDQFIRDGEGALKRGDLPAFAEIELQFHQLIRRASHNHRLEKIMESLDGQIRILISTVPGRGDASIGEHRRILAALEAGASEVAETAMRQHVSNVRATFLAHWQDDDEQPAPELTATAPTAQR